MSAALFCLLVMVLILFTPKATGHEAADRDNNNRVKGIIGAIIDSSSRVGREQRIAMEMAVEDFNASTNQSLVLYVKNSWREPVHAALAAIDLMNQQEVQAILGPQTWEETSSVVEIASNKQIPILSFSEATPKWATERWPFLLQASPNQRAQMKAIADIVQSWEWRQVTVIYEDIDSSATGVIPHLLDVLREVRSEIVHVLALPSFPSSELNKELEKLKQGQCRVFVVHLSLELAVHLFQRAEKMKMMKKDYVWITTDAFTSLVHSINASTISSMQGIIGVRSYLPENEPKFQDFCRRFRKRFGSEYPEEDKHEPGALAVQAYDTVWSVALATKESNKTRNQKLLQRILLSDFDGLTGEFRFLNDQKVAPADIYQVINVIGKSYRELGFWTDGLGFSETINTSASYSSSMKDLGQFFWPGAPWYIPKGWTIPESDQPLRIGVPVGSVFKRYVKVEYDEFKNVTSFRGFSIDLFKAVVEELPYYLSYSLYPFNGSYDDLVKQIYLKKFDAAVGDIAIVARRCQYADFTHPYTESGLVMIVPLQKSSNKALLFLKPFTKTMWILIVVISVYNGFVVWLIERNNRPELKGSALYQMGAFLWLSFSSLFSSHGEMLHSNLSRLTMVVWLFVALIITQTYTANLTSMLTLQGLEPTVDNIETLQHNNAMVGHSNVSFVARYLEDVLGFNRRNLKGYTSVEDYANDLKNRKIAAIFLEVPAAKIFRAIYCKSFTASGPTFKVGGFGFAFEKGFPLLPSVTEALLKVSESGKLKEIETGMIAAAKCVEEDIDDDISSLSPKGYWVLFAITAGTSTIALAIYLSHCNWKINYENLLLHNKIRMLMMIFLKQWGHHGQRFCQRARNAETPGSSPNPDTSEARFALSLSIEPAV